MFPGALCLLLSLSTLCAATAGRQPSLSSVPAPSSRIVGRVVDPRTHAGMGAVRVRLDDGPDEVVTAPDGTFEFADLPPGTHRVVAVLEGFSPSAPLMVTVGDAADVRVELAYSLLVTTEVRGRAEPDTLLPAADTGTAMLTGRQVASAIGGLDDVGRVMQLRPGVAASQDDRNDLLVRGGGAFETAVLIDGFEVPTASHFGWPGSAGGGLGLVPSAVIGRASLETSGFSVAHGERASSVLDLATRAPRPGRLSGQADVGAGGVLGLLGGRFHGGDGSWLVSARRSILEVAFAEGDTQATPSYVDLFGALDLRFARLHQLRILAVGASDGLDVDWSGSTAKRLHDDQTLALAGLSLRSAWTASTETLVSLAISSNNAALTEVEQSAASFLDSSREKLVRVRAEVRRVLGPRFNLMAGASVKHSGLAVGLQDGAYRNEYGIFVPALHVDWTDTFSDAAGYVEVSASPLRRLRAVMGVRADRAGLTSSWYGSPRVHLSYQVTSRWRATGSWGIYRQDVPYVWLASNAANRTLDPVRCSAGTAGVQSVPWHDTTFAVEGFVKRYTGYPIDPNEPARVLIGAGADFDSPLVGRLVPAGLVHAGGVDVSVTRRLGRRLDLAASYSYWKITEHNLEGQWIAGDFDIRHQGRLWAVWRGGDRWSASALWRYASGRPFTPYDVKASVKANAARYDRSRNNAANLPPYHRLDVRAERVFRVKGRALTGFVEIDNLYDRQNVLVYDWSKSLKQADPIMQWGLTPVGGLRFEF